LEKPATLGVANRIFLEIGTLIFEVYKIGTIRKKRGQMGSKIIKVNFFPRSLFLQLHAFDYYVYYFKKLLIAKTVFVAMAQQPLEG